MKRLISTLISCISCGILLVAANSAIGANDTRASRGALAEARAHLRPMLEFGILAHPESGMRVFAVAAPKMQLAVDDAMQAITANREVQASALRLLHWANHIDATHPEAHFNGVARAFGLKPSKLARDFRLFVDSRKPVYQALARTEHAAVPMEGMALASPMLRDVVDGLMDVIRNTPNDE